MRKTLAAAAVLAALLAPLTAATAAQAAPRRHETFAAVFQTINGVDRPTRVVAIGPVHGAGTATQTEIPTPSGETVRFTWHFRRGTVTATADEKYSLTFDAASCTAKATGTGTWKITGGTGRYSGATGSGTFTDRGILIGARDASGACQGPDSDVPPRAAFSVLHGTGTAALS